MVGLLFFFKDFLFKKVKRHSFFLSFFSRIRRYGRKRRRRGFVGWRKRRSKRPFSSSLRWLLLLLRSIFRWFSSSSFPIFLSSSSSSERAWNPLSPSSHHSTVWECNWDHGRSESPSTDRSRENGPRSSRRRRRRRRPTPPPARKPLLLPGSAFFFSLPHQVRKGDHQMQGGKGSPP